MARNFLLSMVAFLFAISVTAQNKWTIYDTSNSGLVSGRITSLAIDAKGNKWIGTIAGVSKFDGTNWTTYTTSNSGLACNQIPSIAIDAEGNKWFGTDSGVSRFDGIIWTTYNISNSGLVNNHILSIAIDAHGNKWFGTLGGVSKFDGVNWTTYTTSNSGLSNNNVNSIAIDVLGNEWFGTLGGVIKFDGVNWTTYSISNSKLLMNEVRSIVIDAQGDKWIGMSWGIVSKFDGTNWTSYKTIKFGHANDTASTITIDLKGIKWFGTVCGISKFDGSVWTTYNESNSGLIDKVIELISIDNNGNKWIGTEGGICKFEDGGAGPLDLIKQKTIFGSVFNDLNGNGIKESGEPLLPNKYVKLINDSSVATTQQNGVYSITRPKGIYSIKYVKSQYWQLTTDSVKTIEITDTTTQITGVDFGIKMLTAVNDMVVDVTGGRSRAGFDVKYWLTYKNAGTQTKSGAVTLAIDPRVTFVSSIPMPDIQTGNLLTWNYANLVSLVRSQIAITLKMPDISYLGDTLTMASTITPQLNDTLPANNTSILRQVVIGAYDPNDKSVNVGEGDNGRTLFNQELTYTIRFQNMGTDTAFNVVVRDTICNKMNIETLRLVSSSHDVTIDIKDNNVVSFIFNNIKLPCDKENEPASHGFVKYAIAPYSNLAENTEVKNDAFIYFDYNPPIATNEVKNTYVSPLPSSVNTKTASMNTAKFYPNPASNEITILNTNNASTIKIVDISGRLLYHQSLVKSGDKINTGLLNSGVYIIQIINDSELYSGKLVKK